jgi:hypothetical protein
MVRFYILERIFCNMMPAVKPESNEFCDEVLKR